MRKGSRARYWTYLRESGALKQGGEELQKAKRRWKRNRDTERKRRERKERPCHIVSLSMAEDAALKEHALYYHLSPSTLLKVAAFAYFDKVFVVPSVAVVYKLEAALLRSFTEIQIISRRASKDDESERYQDLQMEISELRTTIMDSLTCPQPLEELVKEAIKANPTFRLTLQKLLS